MPSSISQLTAMYDYKGQHISHICYVIFLPCILRFVMKSMQELCPGVPMMWQMVKLSLPWMTLSAQAHSGAAFEPVHLVQGEFGGVGCVLVPRRSRSLAGCPG